MERQLDEITEGKATTIAGVISDLKEKGYKIKQTTGGANTVTGIALSDENITVERNTEKTVTYTLVYPEEIVVSYFVEVQGKNYEMLFNNGDITVKTEETNLGELSKEPEVTVTSSNNDIIEANKTEEGKIVLTVKNEIGDVEITIKEINSNVTKILNATTRIPATGLTISQETAKIKVGDTLQLTAIVEPSNTTDEITWKSSDATIATVSNAGLIKGIKTGIATITVTCGSLSKTCTVTAEKFSGLNTADSNPEGALPSGNVTVIEADASKGIVIKDKNNREWVWIVVPKSVTASATTDAQIKEKLIAYAKVYRKGSASQNENWSDTWYNGCGVANATTYNTMYNKMIRSIKTNGGFWIQRYEDGRVNINCATAQSYASQMTPDGIKTSSLLFGIQWDLVCKYLEGKEGLTEAMINKDSSSWGRYNTTRQAGLARNKKMNIYDFAGNLWEKTLEKSSYEDGLSVSRGGGFPSTGSNFPASFRTYSYGNTGSTYDGSFRSTFY